jgi:class 3 adenylate cyclase/tetratricopeptide (TPR) repeat protein
MRCAKCGTENPENKKFCGKCGERLAGRCLKCGAENPADNSFCGDCGASLSDRVPGSLTKNSTTALGSAPRAAAENGEILEGERKMVTMLFADIKGSMDLIEDLDPEEARAIVDPALKLMMEAVQRYGGYVAQPTGDGIFALFGAPLAHEDHPQRALLAALRMQEELKRYSDRIRVEGRLPIQARVGVNTGEVVVRSIRTGEDRTEYAPVGHSTGVAARMQALAPVGSIAATDQVRKLCEGYFVFRSLGPTKVKGVTEPVNVYEVIRLGPLRTRLQRAAARGYTRFVGRDREMEALRHAAEQARASRGQIVAVMADAGVGKSRLFFEFKATSQSGWLVLDALALSHEKATAYAPLLDLLHVYFRITPEDDARTRREKVAGKVTTLERSLDEETLPHFFALLGIAEGVDPLSGMDEQIRRRRSQDAIKRILLRESLNQPLMLIFEDLHCIDDATQGFLNLFAEGVANAPVLLLVNYRPEYTHQWGSKTYYTQLRLDPLGEDSAAEMLSARIGDSPELVPLKQLVLEHTQGNPLFIEELVEALFDEGVLVRNGAVKVTRPLSQLKIPPTVQGILAARIDRLPAEAKELLQTLAVIGSEFPLTLVRQVVQLPDDRLEQVLDVLQSGEFIYEQPATGDVEYIFKHALTRDEAYKSLLAERRKLLHERTAQAIEAVYSQRLEDRYIELAHHYRSSNNAAKAVEYLLLAGEQEVDRGAYTQALANVESSLRSIEHLPEVEQRLRAELSVRLLEGTVVTGLYGVSSPERLRTSERVCELSEQLCDDSALIRGLFNMGFVYANRGEAQRAQAIANRCLALAEQNQEREVLPYVQMMVARCALGSGKLLEAASRFNDLLKGLISPHPRVAAGFTAVNPWVVALCSFAIVQQALGRTDDALRLSDEALRRARQLKHLISVAWALTFAAMIRIQRREPESVRALAEALIAFAEKHGLRERLAEGRSLRGWAMVELGQTEQGLAELEAGGTSSIGVSLFRTESLIEVYLRMAGAEQAVNRLDEELSRFERSGAHLHEPELQRLKGEAILMRDSSATAEAEACFRKAIEIATGQSAKWWELRATVSLARLLRDTDRRDEARAMLAQIYNWFTEGFDTADLKDAKALLDELKS